MKHYISARAFWQAATIVMVLVSSAFAQGSGDKFEEFQARQDSTFNRFTDDMDGKYDAFVARQDSLYEAFVERVDKLWNDHVYPSRTDYVEYSDEYKTRVHVDFEKGNVEASVLVDDEQKLGAVEQARETLKKQLEESVTMPGREEVFELVDPVAKVSGPSLLDGQVANREGVPVEQGMASQFVESVIATSGIRVDTVESKDGKRRIKLSAAYKLVPDHLKKRASHYLAQVEQYAEKYDLDPRLVMAIMHTESYFNPRATSRIPAFGLMQIVPKTAGRDAYKHVYGSDRLLTADYLYDSEKNIELGCAYLHIVRFKYLRGVQSDQIAYPCVIASYNGGIGTVCKALSGSKRLPALAEALQNTEFDDVVKRLNRKLPYQETRDYLNRVLERMPMYDEWAK